MVIGDTLLPFVTCISLFAATMGHAQTADAPDTGPVTDRLFTPVWDGICAQGAALGAGCDIIRAREIVDAARPPWPAVGRVNFASTRIKGHCTGTLVGDRVVVTAAHCLFNRAQKSWVPARSILFAAGYQRGGFEAMSRVERYVLDPVQDPSGQEIKGDPSQDWALLILEHPIGRDAGVAKLGTLTGEELWTAEMVFAGYPALRAHVLSVERDCGGAEYVSEGRLLVQQCPVMSGDSGGPIFAVEGDDLAMVAVLSGVIQDGASLVSASVPVAVFADALARELGPAVELPDVVSVPAAPAALPTEPVVGSKPAPVQPTPPPATIPVYPPPPRRGR